MATLEELEEAGTLRKFTVNLGRGELPRREIYLARDAQRFVDETLRGLTAFEADDLSPAEQMVTLIRRYISGEAMEEDDDFKLMIPVDDDVYEFRTPDVRLYGWFYRPSIFIAVSAATMEQIHSINGLASGHRNGVSHCRANVTLDPPKYNQGASADDVLALRA